MVDQLVMVAYYYLVMSTASLVAFDDYRFLLLLPITKMLIMISCEIRDFVNCSYDMLMDLMVQASVILMLKTVGMF
jgi:hypothetical protein